MALFVASSEPDALYVGGSQVAAVYLGGTQLWRGGVLLAGSLEAGSALSAHLSVARPMAAELTASSAIAGELAVQRPLFGSLAAVSEISGDLSVFDEVLLDGELAAVSNIAGEICVLRGFTAALAASTSLTGGASVARRLSGSMASVSASTSVAMVTRGLSGAMAATSAMAGALTVTPSAASAVFQATTVDGVGRTIYTFAGQNIGSVAATRRVVVAVSLISSSARTISSVTIGGVAATVVPNGQVTTNFLIYRTAFYIATVPTGTTASIVVTASGACDAAALTGVWAVYNLNSSTPVDSDGDTTFTSPFSVPAVNTSAGGILLAAGMYYRNAGAADFGWTNATERSDLSSSLFGANLGNSGADAATTGASVAVSATIAGTVDGGVMVVASFR